MLSFTVEQIEQAVVRIADDAEFPIDGSDAETAQMLAQTVLPAVQALPSHHDCEVVHNALATMFLMGLAVGAELGREG